MRKFISALTGCSIHINTPRSGLRVVTYNVLNAELAERPRHGPYPISERAWDNRKLKLVQELISYSSDVILLQEVTIRMAKYFEAELKPLGYQLLGPQVSLGVSEALDLPEKQSEGHSPVTLVRESLSLSLHSWSVLRLDELGLSSFPVITESDEILWQRYKRVGEDAYAIVARLVYKEAGGSDTPARTTELLVGNAHIHHDPSEPHIKALQVAEIVNYLQAQSLDPSGSSILPVAHVIVGGDFNSVVQKFRSDKYDTVPSGGSSLLSGVYQLLTQSRLESNHPDHPSNRVPGASLSPLLIMRPLVSVYKKARGKEPYVTSKCLDFAATLDYIFVDAVAAHSGYIGVSSTLSLPYDDVHESSVWHGVEAVSAVAPELGCSIPNRDFASDHIAIGCDLSFLEKHSCRLSVIALGAADTFFKVGHYALRLLHSDTGIRVRLALPTIVEARKTCYDMPELEYAIFDRNNLSSIESLIEGFDAVILVPPLDGQCVEFSNIILRCAKLAGAKQVVCIGGQSFGGEIYPRPFSTEIESLCRSSGIPTTTIRLPFFLENLLWYTSRILHSQEFCYPCSGELLFPYTTCKDVGEIVSTLILKGLTPPLIQLYSSKTTSMNDIAEILTRKLQLPVKFVRSSNEQFILELSRQRITQKGAEEMIALWKALEENQASDEFDSAHVCSVEHFLARREISVEDWLAEHLCCFEKSRICRHAQPPRPHAPLIFNTISELVDESPTLPARKHFISYSAHLDENIEYSHTVFTGLKYKISSVAVSKDGSRIIASCINDIGSNGQVFIYRLTSGEKCLQLDPAHTSLVQSACFLSVVGNIFAITGSSDGIVCFWDANNGALISRHNGHSGGVTSVISIPLGCASASLDKTFQIWRAIANESGTTLTPRGQSFLHDAGVIAITASPDFSVLVTCTLAHYIFVWDLR